MPSIPPASTIPDALRPLLAFHPSSTPSPAPRNILILLHGLGDNPSPFLSVARQLKLPSTVYLTIRGPARLPFDLEGFHFADDIQFSQAGVLDPDGGFDKCVKLIGGEIMAQLLVRQCGFAWRDIHLFGLGQGGMAALAAALSEAPKQQELGGVISLGGTLPEALRYQALVSQTPILLCHGSMKSAVTSTRVREVKDKFTIVQVVEWKGRTGDGMPTNQAEMTPLMRFWASRLRMPAPAGTVET